MHLHPPDPALRPLERLDFSQTRGKKGTLEAIGRTHPRLEVSA